MANEKLTWTELRKAVAEMAGTSEQEATIFLNALVDAILVGLKEDQQVKVKGIGTFALKAMAARKSVNIATGEEFTIEGYNKLTFSAEASLKESVEKRLEAPQTVEAVKEVTADPLKKLGEQAEEIVDILADLGQAVSGGSVEVEEVQEVEESSEVQKVQEVQKVEEKKEEVVEQKREENQGKLLVSAEAVLQNSKVAAVVYHTVKATEGEQKNCASCPLTALVLPGALDTLMKDASDLGTKRIYLDPGIIIKNLVNHIT